MNIKITSLLVCIALVGMHTLSEAQLLRGIGKQIQEKMAEGQSDGTEKSTPPAVASNYRFDLGITYAVSTTKGNKKSDQVDMSMWFSEKGYVGTGIEANKNPMLMIYDSEKDAIVNVMEESKTYMVMSSKFLERFAKGASDEETEASGSIEKTGKTETILGYTCEQYRAKDNDTETLLWLSKELGVDYSVFAKNLSKIMRNNQQQLPKGYADMPGGMMLRMESSDVKGKNTYLMEATAVHKDGKTVDLSAYKSTGFGL